MYTERHKDPPVPHTGGTLQSVANGLNFSKDPWPGEISGQLFPKNPKVVPPSPSLLSFSPPGSDSGVLDSGGSRSVTWSIKQAHTTAKSSLLL